MSENILQREDGNDGVSVLTLNRPKAYNSLSVDMMTTLLEALKEISENRDISVVILKGAGKGFSAGHDLKEIQANPTQNYYETMIDRCCDLMKTIMSMPQPVIGQVHGVATAAGCQLVATCDLAIATSDARFATPGVLIGLFCTTPMVALSRNVSRKQAMEMLLTGEMIDAKTALQFGLINRIVPPDELATTTRELASKIAQKSSATIALGKSAFYQQLEMGITEAYQFAAKKMVKNLLMDDAKNGINAFLKGVTLPSGPKGTGHKS